MIAARCDCGTATPATQLAAFGRCPKCVKVERLVDLAMRGIPKAVPIDAFAGAAVVGSYRMGVAA